MPTISILAGLRRMLNFLIEPPRRPTRRLLAWYLFIGVLGTVLAYNFPIVQQAIGSGPIQGAALPVVGNPLNLPIWLPSEALTNNVLMLLAMVGALLLSIPVSWGYMAINECRDFDQSVVQTIVILPVVVAAIMMIVQHSLALAFALAGVSAAVRFRNTLKDVADATYVFLALGIGIAAGVGQLGSAAVMSFVFIFISVTLWRCNYGCPEDAPAGAAAKTGPAKRSGVLSVRMNDGGAERSGIENVLRIFAKTWALDRLEPVQEGGAVARYRVRLRKSVDPETIVHELLFHGEDLVTGAEFVPI